MPGTYAVLYHSLSTPHLPYLVPSLPRDPPHYRSLGSAHFKHQGQGSRRFAWWVSPLPSPFKGSEVTSQTPSTEAAARRSQNHTVMGGPDKVTLCSALPSICLKASCARGETLSFWIMFLTESNLVQSPFEIFINIIALTAPSPLPGR